MESTSPYLWHLLMLNLVDHLTHTIVVLQVLKTHLQEWEVAAGTSLLLQMITFGSLLVAMDVTQTLTAVEDSVVSVSTQAMQISYKRHAEVSLDTGQPIKSAV